MATTQPIRNRKNVTALAKYFLDLLQLRNYVLVVLGFHTALRISDLLRLTWDDVYDFDKNRVHPSIEITEKKTGKLKRIRLNRAAVWALHLYAVETAHRGHPLIINKNTGNAISRIQAYRLIRAAAEAVGIDEPVSCHSLRKTFGYHAWKSGISPVIIMEIYNHSSLAVTRRYLGVTQDDKDKVYLSLELVT